MFFLVNANSFNDWDKRIVLQDMIYDIWTNRRLRLEAEEETENSYLQIQSFGARCIAILHSMRLIKYYVTPVPLLEKVSVQALV